MADDYSWIDDSSNWEGLPNTDFWSSLYASDYTPIDFSNPNWEDELALLDPDLADLWNFGTTDDLAGFNADDLASADLSSLSLSSLANLASKIMSGQSTGNATIDSLLGLAGSAAGLYSNLQNLDWMEMLGDTRDTYGDLLKGISNYKPYTGQEVAGLTDAQKQGIGYAPNLLSTGNQLWTGAGTYDPTKIQQYLNPYVEGGLAAANRLTSQNLTENVLPEINTTFTGQGQFGSTRNAEFQNRAIRDTQQAIADANAKAMVGAYGNADTAYRDMLAKQGQLGQNMLAQGMALGGLGQTQQQNELTSALDAWKRNQEMPITQFKNLTSGVGAFNPAGSTNSNILSQLASIAN